MIDSLADQDARYDADVRMVGQTNKGHAYCTTIPAGVWVHGTVPSLNYALALLRTGEPSRVQRAADILQEVLALQDSDPNSPTYGVWPWYREESLTQMKPPDLNWADFCGARLCEVLRRHAGVLPAHVVDATRAGLAHAAAAIVGRDVGPGYTNIAIMGGAVTASAAELLNDPEMLRYARDRLGKVVEHTERAGGFAEYNSPAYNIVALHECERVLFLVDDNGCRSHAARLLRMIWESIAEHFHPGTQQWAGPHSRAYADHLTASAAADLSTRTGVDIRLHPSVTETPASDAASSQPCPADLVGRFRELPEPEVQVRRRFIHKPSANLEVVGTTWMTDEACLGSVSYANTRDQRRPLIAYWRTPSDPAVVLRLRFLHDGYDFSSMLVRSDQDRNCVLSAFTALTNMGDRAHHLDPPASPGIFEATDFRIRLQLTGHGVAGRQVSDCRFELSAGSWRAVLDTVAGVFGDQVVQWQLNAAEDGVASVDGICYHGPRRTLDLNQIRCSLACGVQLLRSSDHPIDALIQFSESNTQVNWPANRGLRVNLPPSAEQYLLL